MKLKSPNRKGEFRPSGATGGVRKYFVYILTCADGTLYTGITTDPTRRLEEHNRGSGSKYTRGRGPMRISHLEQYDTKGRALSREAELKKMRRKGKLEVIAGGPAHARLPRPQSM